MADILLDSPLMANPPAGLAPLVQGFKTGRDQYPPGLTWADAGPVVAVVSQTGAGGGGPVRQSVFQGYYDQEFYNRIWFDPDNTLDLGAITGRQASRVPVWNAYLTYPGVTIQSVNKINLPDDIIWDDAVPRVWQRLEYRQVDILALAVGAATVNGTFQLIVAGESRTSLLLVTGVRAVAFAWPHNWTRDPEESVQFLTTTLDSENGTQQAVRHRHHPRRRFSQTFVTAFSKSHETNARSQARFNVVTRAMQGREFVVPIWPDAVRLPATLNSGVTSLAIDTVGRDYEPGGYVVLTTDPLTVETLNILSVTDTLITFTTSTQSAWPANRTVIAPGRLAAALDSQTLEELNGEIIEGQILWELHTPTPTTTRVGTWSAPTYRTYPVWTQKPQSLSGARPQRVSERVLVINDNATGLRLVDAPTPGAKERFQSGHLILGRANLKAFFGWLWQQKGRAGLAWYSTWRKDLFPAANMPNDTSLIVTSYGDATLMSAVENRKDVEIVTTGGTNYRRRITNKVDNGNGTSTLTFDSGLGVTLTLAEIDRVSYLRLAYMADEVKWEWKRSDAIFCRLELTELERT